MEKEAKKKKNLVQKNEVLKSGQLDSNQRPFDPQSNALNQTAPCPDGSLNSIGNVEFCKPHFSIILIFDGNLNASPAKKTTSRQGAIFKRPSLFKMGATGHEHFRHLEKVPCLLENNMN